MTKAAWIISAYLLLVPAAAQAASYWVSPDGAAPWASCEGTTPLAGAAACSLATANAEALAGDTVTLRAGDYVGATIQPVASGAGEDARIVFRAAEGEQVVIRASTNGIYLYQQSYVTVDGIDFTDLVRFFRIYAGHHNVISHCDFDGRSAESGEWAAAVIADDPNDDTDASEDSTHNWVHHCSFFRWAWGAFDEHRGALLNIGTDQAAGDDSGYNLIESNTFAYGGHHTIGIYAWYNVIRNNYIHNETNPDGWDFEGYRGAITEGPSAGGSLFEGNRFGFSRGSGMALRSAHNIFRFNLFYEQGSGAIQVVSNLAGVDHADYNAIYHNTFFHNGHLDDYSGFQGGMYFSSWSGQSPVGNIVKNNIFHANRNGSVSYDGEVDPQLIEGNWDEEGDPSFVDVSSPVDPETYPPALPDLQLLQASACIDRGAFLTTVASADGSGSSVQVADASYFIDGWGVVAPDRIQLEGQSDAVSVTAVDYDTETITVDGTLTWTTGQGVSLAWVGTAPDLGAYEYGAAAPCAEQGGTCCATNEQCSGGDFVAAQDCASRCCVAGSCETNPGTGGSGSGGEAGASPAPLTGDGAADDEGGCGCRLATRRDGSTRAALVAWLSALGWLAARRRRRSARTGTPN